MDKNIERQIQNIIARYNLRLIEEMEKLFYLLKELDPEQVTYIWEKLKRSNND